MKRWDSLSATNVAQNDAKIAYVKLNMQTPCPPRGAVPVTQSDIVQLRHVENVPLRNSRLIWTLDFASITILRENRTTDLQRQLLSNPELVILICGTRLKTRPQPVRVPPRTRPAAVGLFGAGQYLWRYDGVIHVRHEAMKTEIL